MNLPTKYHYAVNEFIKTWKEPVKSFDHEQVFDSGNLSVDRKAALDYALERGDGFAERPHFFSEPFKAYKDFDIEMLEGCAYSLSVSLVEVNAEYGDNLYHPIYGEDEDEMREAMEYERSLGIIQ
jgi:hypothetical protein